jgi:hypothetical protein
VRGNGDVDADGLTRRVPFTAGAFQAAAVDLVPVSTRLGLSGATSISWSATLAVASGAVALTAGHASLAWSGGLAPSMAHHIVAAGSPQLHVAMTLAPSRGVQPMRTGTTIVALAMSNAPLGVDGAAMLHRAGQSMLLGDDARAAATLIVGPDPRTLVPTRY